MPTAASTAAVAAAVAMAVPLLTAGYAPGTATAATTTNAAAAAAAVPSGTVFVQSAVNGLNAADTGSGIAMHRPKGNEDRQQWSVSAASSTGPSGRYELRSTDAPARCLGRSGDRAAVVACGSAEAAWTITPAPDGTYTLTVPGTATHLALAPASGGVHPEQPVLASGGSLARWYLTPSPLPRTALPPADQRRLDQVTFLTAHNAYANGVDGGYAPWYASVPNQARGINQQLADGVRGFQLDIHQTPDGAILCHNTCTWVSGPVALWVDLQRIVDFLKAHPGEFVTVFLEDYVSADVLRAELERVRGLDEVLFRPDREGVREKGWPTMGELRSRGKQLMIFSDRTRSDDGGARESFGVMYQRDWTVENYWSMGSGLGSSDWSCYSRWYGGGVNIPLTRKEPGFRPLFVMNHFRDVPITATASADNSKILNRAENFCAPAARKKPNYLAVDHYHLGNPASAVERLNSYDVAP